MRMASTYYRKGKYFVHSLSQTTDGVWILQEPCLSFLESGTSSELGTGILLALSSSRLGIPHPTNWNGLFDPLLRLAEVKSWAKFAQCAQSVVVTQQDNTITITPSKPVDNPAIDGFPPDVHLEVTVEVDPDRIGAQVRSFMRTT